MTDTRMCERNFRRRFEDDERLWVGSAWASHARSDPDRSRQFPPPAHVDKNTSNSVVTWGGRALFEVAGDVAVTSRHMDNATDCAVEACLISRGAKFAYGCIVMARMDEREREGDEHFSS